MAISLSARAILLALTAALAACAEQQVASSNMGDDDNFGEANRQTMAAQIIDPSPAYSTLVPETSGAHSAQAIERYNTDKVKRPDNAQNNSQAGSTGGNADATGMTSAAGY